MAWPLQPIDDAARAWAQAHRSPALETPMHVLSDKSRLALLAGVAVALVSGPGGRAFVLEAALAAIPANLVVQGLKWGVDRTRPDGSRKRANSSFPSSHAANAFTVAAVLARRWRRAAIPAWLLAAAVAYSRIYLDRHWLSDVLFGLPLAFASAWCAARLLLIQQRRTAATRTA
jgi:undecaprenyl-diphosphatase